MASLEESIVDILTGDATLASLVGDRIEPAPRRRGTLPAIAYLRVSTMRLHAHSGDVGLMRTWMQFDVWGETATSVLDVVQSLHGALEHYRGTVAGVRIDAALSLNDRSIPAPETNDQRRIVEYYLWSNL